MPEHPSNHPVLLLNPLSVSAQVIHCSGLSPGGIIYADDLTMNSRFTDLSIAVRRLYLGIIPVLRRKRVGARSHSSSSLNSFFLSATCQHMILASWQRPL